MDLFKFKEKYGKELKRPNIKLNRIAFKLLVLKTANSIVVFLFFSL